MPVEKGPKDLREIPQYFGRAPADIDYGSWNIEIVAAFMRAAYGKGYCDSLTEESPGSLCLEHGYRVPGHRPEPSRER